MPRSLEETRGILKQHGVQRVRLGLLDIQGAKRGTTVSVDAFQHVAVHGMDAGAFGVPDARVRVDLESLRRPPHDPGAAWFLCDLLSEDGTNHPACARSAVHRAAVRARDMGLTPQVALTLSFTAYREDRPTARAKGFCGLTPLHGGAATGSWLAASESGAFVAGLWEVLRGLEVAVDSLTAWEAPGAFTATLRPLSPALAADHAALFKLAAHEYAHLRGHSVTFMARPEEGTPRRHAAIHVSLWNQAGTENLCVGEDHKPTPMAEAFYAGLLEYLGAAVTFLCPTVNSYAWSAAELDAPALGFAMPARGDAISGAHGVRLAVGGPDMHPHLAVATALFLGLHGLDRKSEPPHGARERVSTRRNLDVPNTWEDALGRLKLSTLARTLLGNGTVEAVLAAGREELEATRRSVTQVELARLFENT